MPAKARSSSTIALATAALFLRRRRQASCHNDLPAIVGLAPARTSWVAIVEWSVIAHPRIEERIEDVDDQIENDNEYGNDDHRSHHQRVIAAKRTLDEIAADARYTKDRLHDHRTRQQRGGGRPQIGNDRQDGGTQRMDAY